MNLFKKTTSHMMIYSLGNILLRLISIFLLPIYTSKISIKDFGIYGLIETSIIILSTILSLNIATAMLKWMSDSSDEIEKQKILFNSLFVSLILPLIFVIFSILASGFLIKKSVINQTYGLYIVSASIIVFFEIWSKIPLNLIRYLEKPLYYVVSVSSKLLVSVFFIIYFVLFKQLGIIGILFGQILGGLCFSIVTLPLIIKHTRIKIDKSLIYKLLLFSIPLILSNLGSMIFTQADKYLIKILSNLYQLGLYNFATKISRVVNLIVIQSFNLALLPIAFKIYKTEEGKAFIAKTANLIVFFVGFIGVCIASFGKGALSLIVKNPEYLLSFDAIIILIITYIFDALKYIFMLSLYFTNQTKKIGFIYFFTALFNVILNIILIPKYGYRGAGFSTLLSTIILTWIFYYYGKKYYPLNYNLPMILSNLLISISFIIILFTLKDQSLLKIISPFIYISVLQLLKIIDLRKLSHQFFKLK